MKFDAKGNIVYGEEGSEVAFHDYWSRDFTQLDKEKYSTNGIIKISEGLKFEGAYQTIEGGTNQEITAEAMNSLWDQANVKSRERWLDD